MVVYEIDYHDHFHKKVIHKSDQYNLRAELSFKRYFSEGNINKSILEFGIGTVFNTFLFQNRHGYDRSKYVLDFSKQKRFVVYDSIDEIPKIISILFYAAMCYQNCQTPMKR